MSGQDFVIRWTCPMCGMPGSAKSDRELTPEVTHQDDGHLVQLRHPSAGERDWASVRDSIERAFDLAAEYQVDANARAVRAEGDAVLAFLDERLGGRPDPAPSGAVRVNPGTGYGTSVIRETPASIGRGKA